MFVQMCVKGVNYITLDDAKDILRKRGLVCTWGRLARQISSAEIDQRLTEQELYLHLHAFDEKHPARGGLVRNETPFISLTAGSVQRDAFLAQNVVHPAHEIAMDFATDFGQRQGDCFVFRCWVFVGAQPNVAVRSQAEEVRELHTYTKYSPVQPLGEIVAKIEVPARQIEKFEHYQYVRGGQGKLQIRRLGIYDNPNYIDPHTVTNYRDHL